MRYIKLYEKYIAPFDSSKKKAESRLDNLKMNQKTLDEAIDVLRGWFYGDFMMKGDDAMTKKATDIMRKIGKVYHQNPIDEMMYRITHLHIKPGMESKDIRKINKAQSGPKQLQSWSTTKEGAQWFFNHFVKEQNQDATPDHSKAWVLLSTEANNLDQLLTFEECIQFLYDVSGEFGLWFVEEVADHLVSDEMLKLHELICHTPTEVPVKIENILVPPIKKKITKKK